MGLEDQVALWFSQYAYQPMWVYLGVVLLMFASSFGLPVPEEVTLISAGLVAYMAMHPDLYPPPYEGAKTVNLYILATVCFLAVIGSDFLIFWLGKYFGRPLLDRPRFQRYFSREAIARVESWVLRYGPWAAGIFRFTPGLRFPGHMMCGMMGFPPSRFLAVDGTAALLTVPTQIILVAHFGSTILYYLGRFKFILAGILLAALLAILIRKIIAWRQEEAQQARAQKGEAPAVAPAQGKPDNNSIS
jgi:membrane protein DedA with SNARE-associated domain